VGNAIRRGFFVSIAVAALTAISPAVAAETTFYVHRRGATRQQLHRAATPCLTIQHAVGASETTPGVG